MVDVQRNIKTVKSQTVLAEEELNTLLVIRQPEVHNEGLPLTEIREELDEEGNVICIDRRQYCQNRARADLSQASITTRPDDAAPQVVEALRKAGVKDLPSVSSSKPKLSNKDVVDTVITPPAPAQASDIKRAVEETTKGSTSDGSKVLRGPPLRVSEIGAAAVQNEGTIDTPTTSDPLASAGSSNGPHDSVTKDIPLTYNQDQSLTMSTEVNDDTTDKKRESRPDLTARTSPPVIPIDESPEDAALRRQMIQYGLHEVGAVVAELELDDESGSQYSYSDDDVDGDEEYTSGTDDEEDAFGRTKRRVVDDDYRKQMLELEKKLNVRGVEKPRPEIQINHADSNNIAGEQTGAKAIPSVLVDKSQKSMSKKGVRFADELDISPAPAPPSKSTGASVVIPTMQDLVVERTISETGLSGITSSTPKKTSRFKMAREAAQQHDQDPATGTQMSYTANGPLNGPIRERTSPNAATSFTFVTAMSPKRIGVPTPLKEASEEATRQESGGPPGKTHVSNIIERAVSSDAVDAPDPDDMDPNLLQQEVAVEYHRMRNRMIQREGGFLPHDDQEVRIPLTEEEGGSGKKMSRFKAARLRGHV